MSRDNELKTSQSVLPSPKEFKASIPLALESQNFIENSRNKIRKILNGKDPSLILIVGPCSIHDVNAAKEYACKLKALAEDVSGNFTLIMRVYFAKARSTLGWKGLLFDPVLDDTNQIFHGIKQTRQLLVDLAKLNIMTASEFLDPITAPYFEDLITWGCIGARTSESQTHRILASGLPMPIAFKNNTDGNIKIAVDGALVASHPHTHVGINEEGLVSTFSTAGNPHAHVVLRGGKSGTNYDPKSISETLNHLKQAKLLEKVIIDCSHGNCQKNSIKQPVVFESVINQVIEGNNNISGLILESYLIAGNQNLTNKNITSLVPGQSITDPCLDWDTTKKLILWGHERLTKHKTNDPHTLAIKNHASNLISN